MSVSRVVTAVGKVGFFCVVVFIGVLIFRGTPIWSNLTDGWAMQKCPELLQADLNVLLMEKRPKVRGCVGPATRAICQVETADAGSTLVPKPEQKDLVKTAPLGPWDCTRPHVPKGAAGWIMKAMMDSRKDAAPNRLMLQLANASSDDMQLIDERASVASLLDVRQAIIDGQ